MITDSLLAEWLDRERIVGHSSPTFLGLLNSTPNAETGKVGEGCAVIQALFTSTPLRPGKH